jgi:ribosomal protein S18 acetylase RimI-like enzyme
VSDHAPAEFNGQIVGVGQCGRRGPDHVIYKLYVDPQHRGRRLGPQLIDALVSQLPNDVDRLNVEQFAANERAGAFYPQEAQGTKTQTLQPFTLGHRPGIGFRSLSLSKGKGDRWLRCLGAIEGMIDDPRLPFDRLRERTHKPLHHSAQPCRPG